MAVMFVKAAQGTVCPVAEGKVEGSWACLLGLVGVERCRRGCHDKANEVGSWFLLFPTAVCFLSRISSLSGCSLSLSPCSYLSTIASSGDAWLILRVPAW
jgi:hypothetical protein